MKPAWQWDKVGHLPVEDKDPQLMVLQDQHVAAWISLLLVRARPSLSTVPFHKSLTERKSATGSLCAQGVSSLMPSMPAIRSRSSS